MGTLPHTALHVTDFNRYIFDKKKHQKDGICTFLILIAPYFVSPFYIVIFFGGYMCLFLIDLWCLVIGDCTYL